MNILIVDDDHNLCQCLLALLPWKGMGCNVPEIAYNGLHALEVLRQKEIDFVISDLKMPGMDGIELCKTIRKDFGPIDIVILSAYEDFDSARQALSFGVSDYILKPLNREGLNTLEAIIRKAVGRNVIKTWNTRLFSSEYRMKIISAVFQKDEKFLENLFERLGQLGDEGVLSACMYLMRILSNYRQQKTSDRILFSSEEIAETRYETLVQIRQPDQMIAYVRSQYEHELKGNSELSVLVQNAKKIIEENFHILDYNASGIANRLNVSPGYLGRAFSREMGVGILDYISDLRMQKACALLAQGIMSISEISDSLGYADPNYFAKVFRQKMGLSPTQYRKTFYVGTR